MISNQLSAPLSQSESGSDAPSFKSQDAALSSEDARRIKVVLAGDSDVGKSSLLACFARGSPLKHSQPTIGAQFCTKFVSTRHGQAKLVIWDTAGSEKYKSITRSYFRGINAAVIVFDLTREASLRGAEQWLRVVADESGPEPKVLLLGNKADIAGPRVDPQKIEKLAKQFKAIFSEVSAKTGFGVRESFCALAEALLSQKQKRQDQGFFVTLVNQHTEQCCL